MFGNRRRASVSKIWEGIVSGKLENGLIAAGMNYNRKKENESAGA